MRTRIVILGLIYLLMLGSVLAIEKESIINYNWQELFTEPVERMYVVMKNRIIFRVTSNDEKSININFGIMERELKKRNYKTEDIEIIIHSHFADCNFSDSDEKQNRTLKRRGFNGLFLLYCHRTKEVYDIEGEKKSN